MTGSGGRFYLNATQTSVARALSDVRYIVENCPPLSNKSLRNPKPPLAGHSMAWSMAPAHACRICRVRVSAFALVNPIGASMGKNAVPKVKKQSRGRA